MLTATHRTFLETAKKEGFKLHKGHVMQSGYFDVRVEVPGGLSFSEEEITQHFCQGCEDDENEGIEIYECICQKEKYRGKVKSILDLLFISQNETLEIIG